MEHLIYLGSKRFSLSYLFLLSDIYFYVDNYLPEFIKIARMNILIHMIPMMEEVILFVNSSTVRTLSLITLFFIDYFFDILSNTHNFLLYKPPKKGGFFYTKNTTPPAIK